MSVGHVDELTSIEEATGLLKVGALIAKAPFSGASPKPKRMYM